MNDSRHVVVARTAGWSDHREPTIMRKSRKPAHLAPVLTAVLGVMAVAGPSSAQQLFSWNADQLKTTSIGSIVAVGSGTSIDLVEKVEGLGSMRLNVPGDNQAQMGIEPGAKSLGAGTTGGSLYYRWWMKIDLNFSWGSADRKMKSNRVKRSGDVPPPIYTMYLTQGDVYVGECSECAPGGTDPSNARIAYDFNPSTNAAVTKWQEYIIQVKMQSAPDRLDGAFYFWVNGVKIGSGVNGMRFVTSTVGWVEAWGANMVRPLPQLNSPGAGGTIWIDDVSLDTTFNSRSVEPTCPGGSAPDPHVLWCDNFDDSTPLSQKYFEYDDDGGDFIPLAGEGLDGSRAMRARWQTAEVGAGSLTRTFGRSPVNSQSHSTTDFREIYWRLYVKMQPGWTGSPDKLSRATIFATSNWAQAMIAHIWSSGDFLMMDPASGIDTSGNLATTKYNDFANLRWIGARTGTTPLFTSAASGTWHCVESHVKLNTPGLADGVFEFWIDGNSEARRTDMDWIGTWQGYGINAVFFENYWNAGAPAERIRYFDNIVIATQRIGCLDARPPSAPTGLAIR
jgi:hypothetical protein